jgi:hypothetical protein
MAVERLFDERHDRIAASPYTQIPELHKFYPPPVFEERHNRTPCVLSRHFGILTELVKRPHYDFIVVGVIFWRIRSMPQTKVKVGDPQKGGSQSEDCFSTAHGFSVC